MSPSPARLRGLDPSAAPRVRRPARPSRHPRSARSAWTRGPRGRPRRGVILRPRGAHRGPRPGRGLSRTRGSRLRWRFLIRPVIGDGGRSVGRFGEVFEHEGIGDGGCARSRGSWRVRRGVRRGSGQGGGCPGGRRRDRPGAGEGLVAEEAHPGAEAGAGAKVAEGHEGPAVVGGRPLQDDLAPPSLVRWTPTMRRSSSAARTAGCTTPGGLGER